MNYKSEGQGTRYYIASKVNNPEAEAIVQGLHREMASRGYLNTYDWIGQKIERPFSLHPEVSVPAAQEMVSAVKNADIFILVFVGGMTGALIETGIALAEATTVFGKPLPSTFRKQLFLLGVPDVIDRSIFFQIGFAYMPSVEALLTHLGPAKPLVPPDPQPH